MPPTSIDTLEPIRKCRVKGMINGARTVSITTSESDRELFPSKIDTHIILATAVGIENSSTIPAIRFILSGNIRCPSPQATAGIAMCSISMIMIRLPGLRITFATSRNLDFNAPVNVINANTYVTYGSPCFAISGKHTPTSRHNGVTKAIHFSIKLLNFLSIL